MVLWCHSGGTTPWLCLWPTAVALSRPCRPNLDNQQNVLLMAQSAYFLGVVVARWADLLICKTRKESIFNQVHGPACHEQRRTSSTALPALLAGWLSPPFWPVGLWT